jgi:hypothetical protein
MALVAVMIAAPEVSAAAAKPSTTTRTTTLRHPTVNHKLTTTTQPRPPTVKKTIKVTPTQAPTVAKRATRVGTIQKKRHKNHGHSHGPVHGIVTGVQHSKSGGGAFEVRVLHKHHKHYHSKKSGRHAGGAKAVNRVRTPTSVKRTTKQGSSDRKFYVTTHTVFIAMRGSRGATTTHHVPFADLKKGDDVLVFAHKSIAHKVDILGGHHKHHKTPKKKKNV